MAEHEDNKVKAKAEAEKISLKDRVLTFYRNHKAEFDKIMWPSRQELTKKTITVIVTSLIFAVIIFAMDSVYSLGYNFLVGLLG